MKHCVMNAPERPEYADALNELEPILYNLPPKVVAIDGKPGVGKTTLGRFLAWRFNISLIETDLYLHRSRGLYIYREEEVKGVINSRKQSDRPVIVEGVVALRLLDNLNVTPDFHIHVICEAASSSTASDYPEYLKQFQPAENANLVLNLSKLSRT
ncbi:MAG: hypothetical protein COA69_03820 [Robiginitomaculum sp.]|nr:MAG: hypothetical protein COA69_03820 [Robiginitomaculum sp.]